MRANFSLLLAAAEVVWGASAPVWFMTHSLCALERWAGRWMGVMKLHCNDSHHLVLRISQQHHLVVGGSEVSSSLLPAHPHRSPFSCCWASCQVLMSLREVPSHVFPNSFLCKGAAAMCTCVCVCAHARACLARRRCAQHTVEQRTAVKGEVDSWGCLKVGSPLKGEGRQREEREGNIVQFLPFQSFELTRFQRTPV